MEEHIKQLILIPDVHGRTFWKDALYYIHMGYDVVFLGDYLDPYPHEGHQDEDVFANFEDIVSLAQEHPNVHLLIGNHDCGYFFTRQINDCRTMDWCFHDLRGIFRDNEQLFNFAYHTNIGGRNIMVTHAGVDKRWWLSVEAQHAFCGLKLDKTYDPANVKMPSGSEIANLLNNVPKVGNKALYSALAIYSRTRGWGGREFGSCIWQDIHDWGAVHFDGQGEDCKPIYTPTGLDDTFQIVGHTMQLDEHIERTEKSWKYTYTPGKPVYNVHGNVLCIDCQECFYVDDEGTVRYLKNDKPAVE